MIYNNSRLLRIIKLIALQQMKLSPFLLLSIITIITIARALSPAGDIRIYPNTQNSPSLYLIQFTLSKAIPSKAYILVTMSWYQSSLIPYHCIFVNSSIAITCGNLNSPPPQFSLSFDSNLLTKFNSLFNKANTVAVQVQSGLLANTVYSLQLHLYNVVPFIQKISPSIQMYTVSSNGLIYESNTNFGAVVNNPPNTQLMGVSILNDLSANSPGSLSTLKAEISISQQISTAISTFIFVIQYPFVFSLGSIPTAFQSTSYATNPISLYSKPTILSYQIVSPNVFSLVFNQQFTVGRKFIIQIDQINNPFLIAAANISIYSLNFNTLTPLQAFQMLYTIKTVSYPLPMTLGLPYGAPFTGAMQYYQGIDQFVQVQVQIPYTVPIGYSLMIQLNGALLLAGTAYSSFQSLVYTPVYKYVSNNVVIVSSMGSIIIGTTITLTFQINIQVSSLFQINAKIDTTDVINLFTASDYMYSGSIEGSGIVTQSFFNNFRDSTFTTFNQMILYSTAPNPSQIISIEIRQIIGNTATSSGSYLQIYLSPNVMIGVGFDTTTDCLINSSPNYCILTYYQTPTYLKLTIKGSSTYLSTNPNMFPYNTYTTIILKNIYFPVTSSNKNLYPVYVTLFKSDIVNPIPYYYYKNLHVMPSTGALTGVSFNYINNFFTNTPANYQTYPGALRFESATPPQLSFIIQPNQQFVIVFFAQYGFRSFPTIANMDKYPCTSNIAITCMYFQGLNTGGSTIFTWDHIVVKFSNISYSSTNFHILLPDTQTVLSTNYFFYQTGFYNQVTKDILYNNAGSFQRSTWISTPSGASINLSGDMLGKAGSYRKNVSIIVNNPTPVIGKSFIFLCTQWSFFQNGISKFSTATQLMSSPSPATFRYSQLSPLSVYLTGGMYMTVIPFIYVSATSPFTFYLDNVHMPYTYDLPTYYIYIAKYSDFNMAASNSFIMTNGGTFYSSPLQSLTVVCQDNAIGVVNTYCTVTFGTSNPLLASGNIRLSLSGLTVATSTCSLTASNGTVIPVTCSSSTDNKNVTATLTGFQFYPAGNFTLVVYGIGISNTSLSQSITLYLYEAGSMYVIQSGVRILMTTIAGLSYITLSQIIYSYLNPLSSNTMTISFYLPRSLYADEQFAFVVGQDISDVNTQVARLSIYITRSDGVILYPLYSIDNINYLIIFSFADPSQLSMGNYTMTINGILTPASQSNGAFNMIYRRIYDYAYTIVNSANVIFPSFGTLITSNISLNSYFNTEGYKQDLAFTIVNSVLNVDSNMVWIINFPSYYSPQVFQQDAYCMIDTAFINCAIDPTTPYQIIVSNSPKMIDSGVPYTITVIGIACPRKIYTNGAYPNRYIFVGVLQNVQSTSYSERSLLLPYQTIQQFVNGVVKVQDMVGVSVGSLFSFSSIYAQFQLSSNTAISAGSYLYIDLPLQYDNLNNIGINSILVFGPAVNSSSTVVKNRKIQIPIAINITANSPFQVQFPNMPTPKIPCITRMSDIIVTVTLSNKLSIYAASTVQGNSAPTLTYVKNNRYVSFNNDLPIRITAGTYSVPITIASSDAAKFLSNTNIKMQSTGFVFEPETVFMAIGQSNGKFRVGADSALVPVIYFYQAIKQEEINTNYQITLNMNIQVTNDQVPIVLPASLNLPLGGCTNPFIIKLTNPPFQDLTISYIFDNSVYSENDLFQNPSVTPSQMTFTSIKDNNTFSFCSTSNLVATQIPISFYLSGTNYNSYTFSPSNQILLNVVNAVANVTPTLQLVLNNQQKTFLDVNFTTNVDSMVFYQMILGQNQTPLDLQSIQVYIKSNIWVLSAQTDFMTHLSTVDKDNRLNQFFQIASTATIRISNLVPQAFYTLCGYAVNVFGVSTTVQCLQLSTMTWGTIVKANIRFSHSLTSQELNNVLCFFTSNSSTNHLYLVDLQGNSCGNRSVANNYFKYIGNSVTNESTGTSIYLLTNPTLIGTDPAPSAFSSLFSATGSLSLTTLTSAQSMFSITYLSGTYANSYNARLMTASTQPSAIYVYFDTPVFDSVTHSVTINNIQMMGGIGSVYFVLVLYKQISINGEMTSVSIRLNYAPSAEQVLNCQSWLNIAADGCARAVYSGVASLKVTFTGIQGNSMYMLYYVTASEFPLRPIVSGVVNEQTVVTYSNELLTKLWLLLLLTLLLIV